MMKIQIIKPIPESSYNDSTAFSTAVSLSDIKDEIKQEIVLPARPLTPPIILRPKIKKTFKISRVKGDEREWTHLRNFIPLKPDVPFPICGKD